MTEQERNELHERIAQVKERVARAAEKAGKKPEDIILVAASKMNDTERVQEAIRAGIEVCGENRVQEIQNGTFRELMEKLMEKPVDEIRELYNNREIEK